MSNEETLKAGIAAAKSGDIARAAALFANVVQADPTSEQGWLWLGMSLTDRDRREYCFRRALALDPNNNEAKSQLASMSKPVQAPPPQAPPPRAEPPKEPAPLPPVHPIFAARPVQSQSPFTTEETPFHEVPIKAEPVQTPPYTDQDAVEEPQRAPLYMEETAFEPEEKPPLPLLVKPVPTAAPKRKKLNPILIIALGFTATLILGGAVVALLFLTGAINPLMAGFLPAPPSPIALAPLTQPTVQITAASTQAPQPTQTQTQVPPTALPTSKPLAAYAPVINKVDCQFVVPAGANVTCAWVIVPEDRTGDPTHTIRLAVAVYHNVSANPAPDPVVFLQGGPGGEAVKLITGYYRQLVVPILQKRDFIVFDQRGTGLSDPALNCDELSKAYLQDVEGLIPSSTRGLVYSNAMVSCSGLMSAKGINLNAYTTVESADDIKDILSVLGYQKADLYGASYGTRLAQVVMRDHPEIVNSVILDSVVPVETNFFVNYPASMEAGLKNLFDTCGADANCNAAYPNLGNVFWDLLKKLDANPVTITTGNPRTGTVIENVDGSTAMNMILGSIKESDLINTAPQTIYRFKDGDFSTLIATQSSLPNGFEGINIGLFISMMCHEHILATTPEQLQATTVTSKDIEEYAWLPFYGSAQDIFKTCQEWRSTGPTLGENAQVNSDIPTLVIAGKFDPTTPPMYAKQVAGHLSHSFYFEFPNLGHVPTATDKSGCAMATVISFLNNPTTEPDRTCLNTMSAIHFITPYTGTPALQLTTVKAGGMSDKVPENWTPTGDGFFFRGESPFDITSVGFLEANVDATGLKDWFSMKAYGYRGFDTALVPAGKRDANNLTWNLYTSTSYGRPVDIAMADYHGRSLLVVSFSNSDEHDVLYKTVFLPMIDSAQP